MKRVFSRTILISATILAWSLPAAAQSKIDYARDVLPILSAKCYHCHGPDEEARKRDLRLDTKEGAFRIEDGVAVVVPGKPAESELVRRITSSDPDEVMPPSEDIRKLTPAQIDTLKRWVEQGAPWGAHWAFVAPQSPPVPAPASEWGHNPIDALVLARMMRDNHQPAAEADRATLIRRVTFDLTGLPPTLSEVERFVGDESPNAYEQLVDRLLASPRYGERMATDWLEVARYADTHGYQMDRYRAMWPWRDWVIKAFNENLPFDAFVTWQLAGDLLPNPTKQQRLATAFNRLHMQNEEGGVVEEEFRVAYVVDRVTTVGTALLGLTLECSRCHDHKYDPITQRDFYSMFAFFQNIDESGQTTFFTDAMPVPTMLLSDDAQDAKLADLRGKLAAKQDELQAAREQGGEAFDRWVAAKRTVPADLIGSVARYTFDDPASTQPAFVAVDGPRYVPGRHGNGAELSGENGFTFPGVGQFARHDPFSLSIWLATPAHAPRMVVVHKSKAPIDAGSRGYEILLESGRVAFGLHHTWPANSLKVVTREIVPVNQWTQVTVTYDGSSKAAGVRIYIDGAPADVEIIRDGLFKDITYGGDEPPLTIGHRYRDNGFKGGKIDEFRVFDRALTPIEVARVAGNQDVATRDAMFEYFLATAYEPAKRIEQAIHTIRRSENELITAIPEAMVMQELPQPRPAFVLKRGAYDAPGERVTADTPGFLPPFPADQPRNRLGLAKWMFDPANPLTARVTVNRAWQQMFGRGIVETSDNFGTQGSQPSHPALLDWLARTFADTMRWDMKRLLKTIAMSATYRQASPAPAELLASDPHNALLARGPARRLSAEMLRDQSLALSGLLVEKLGGPSVKPYQPDGIWDVAMGRPAYVRDQGEGLYRRSLYTFWKRSVPPPAMTVFDAADKNVCTVRRQSTSTPLQALALLNDTQHVEAARFISQRMLTEGGSSLADRIEWAFHLVTARPASAAELAVLQKLFSEQRELFANDLDAATKLLAVGDKPANPKLDRADLAAGTVLAIALLNHDAAVMHR